MRVIDGMKWNLATIVVVGAVIFGGIALVSPGTLDNVTGQLSAITGDGDDGNDGVEMVSVAEYTVDGEVTLPTTVSSADAYLFEKKPDTDSPVHYGDFVDFDATEATSGLTEGVDYEKVSVSSKDTITFSDLDAGQYNLVLVDTSSPRDYHYRFMQVSMPDQVAKFKVEQSQPIKLAKKSEFDRFDTIKSDDAVAFNSDRSETVSLSADLDSDSSNLTDRQRTVERTIELSGGKAYLGKVVADNLNDKDGISQVEVTVTVDGEEKFSKTLLDGSTDEFGSDNSYSKELVDNPQENPVTASSDVVVTVDVTYDYNTDYANSDNGDIGDAESMLDFKMTDIYGNTLGSAGTSSMTG
jgi:hypothetical protein